MKILYRLAIVAAFAATQAFAQIPGHKGTLSIALLINEEVGAYPATTAQKAALESKQGNYLDPLDPAGYVIPPNGLQNYQSRTTPAGKITVNPTSGTLSGTYIGEFSTVIKSKAYNNTSFLADAVKIGRLTAAQSTGAKLVTIRLTGGYSQSRIYIFAEGAKGSPQPAFLGFLDNTPPEDLSNPAVLITGQYGAIGFGRATAGRTEKTKVVLVNDMPTTTELAVGGTTLTGIDLQLFPYNSEQNFGINVSGALTVKDNLSSLSVYNLAENIYFRTTKNAAFAASGLVGSGMNRGKNNSITGSIAITSEAVVRDVGHYLNSTGLPGEYITSR